MPVVHIGVNLQPFSDAATDAFVATYGLGIVGDDYTAATQWTVRNSFFPESGQPLFAIIALVPDSPSHQMGELIVRYPGYGQSDFTARMAEWRALIDTVRPPPERPVLGLPAREGNGSISFTIQGEEGRLYEIHKTLDFVRWDYVDSVEAGSGPVVFSDSGAAGAQGFYRAQLAEGR